MRRDREGACTATGQTEVTYPLFCYVFNDSPVHAAPPPVRVGRGGCARASAWLMDDDRFEFSTSRWSDVAMGWNWVLGSDVGRWERGGGGFKVRDGVAGARFRVGARFWGSGIWEALGWAWASLCDRFVPVFGGDGSWEN